jgi:Bacterial CdiA-CT RNAse A domain
MSPPRSVPHAKRSPIALWRAVTLIVGLMALLLGSTIATERAGAARLVLLRADTIDLAADEALGGHTLARHVGKTEAELKERLAEEPHIPAASSFRDREEAERFVSAALRAKDRVIRRWLEFARPGERFPVYYRADAVVGYGIPRSTGMLEPMSKVVVVLERTDQADKPYFVLAAYPDP